MTCCLSVSDDEEEDDAAAGGGGRCRGGGSLCSETHPVPRPQLHPPGGVRALRQHRRHLVLRRAGRNRRPRETHPQQHVQRPPVRPHPSFRSCPVGRSLTSPSPLYRTNLPKEVMMFPDFPFDPQLNSFLPHQEVQRYLETYCQSYDIRPHIRVSRPAAGHQLLSCSQRERYCFYECSLVALKRDI